VGQASAEAEVVQEKNLRRNLRPVFFKMSSPLG
jgi:hypothetical protein